MSESRRRTVNLKVAGSVFDQMTFLPVYSGVVIRCIVAVDCAPRFPVQGLGVHVSRRCVSRIESVIFEHLFEICYTRL